MKKRKGFGIVVVAGVIAALVAGCGSTPLSNENDELSNQGGGSLITAGLKIATESMTDLTPDEIQIIATSGADLLGVDELPEIDDDQAQLIVDLLVDYDLSSIDEIGTFLSDAASGQVSVDAEDVAALLSLFGGATL